jgi:hypothetical protein
VAIADRCLPEVNAITLLELWTGCDPFMDIPHRRNNGIHTKLVYCGSLEYLSPNKGLMAIVLPYTLAIAQVNLWRQLRYSL